ncbi:hypothetical protein R3P38DRAFT_2649592, partial [Favolaschia claudopus]
MNPSGNAHPLPVPPLHSIFNTNYIPTDHEISQIRAHILPYEAELAKLNALIQHLSARRDQVKYYVDSHKALISHPRRLPQDILAEIFLACLPTTHDAVMSPTEPPLLLGRICSRWRSIAFAFPRLWSSLHIYLRFVDAHEKRVAAVDEWLKRASPLPLSISVRSGDPGFDPDFKDEAAVVDILTRLSSRWFKLRLHKLSDAAFSRLAAQNAPALSDVEIHLREDFAEYGAKPFLASTLLLGQSQRRISLAIKNPLRFVPSTPFTWNHVTDLSLERIDPSPVIPKVEPLMVSFLETLRIENDSTTAAAFEHFIDNLIMPQLTKLHLVNDNSYYSKPVEPSVFERLADRSPLMSEIVLSLSSGTSTVDVLRGPKYLDNISKLNLVLWTPYDYRFDTANDEALFTKVLAPDSPSNPVPALADLTVETLSILEETWREFLRKHITHSTNLRRFRLHLWIDSLDDIPDLDFTEFLTAGLDVLVDYGVYKKSWQGTPWGGIDGEHHRFSSSPMSRYREPALSESPFYEHLHTNYIPMDAGIAQIRGHLAPHEEEFARLDTLIRDLVAKRDRIKRYLDAHKALISCLRRLPPELLQKIFVDCLPTTHNAVMSVAAAPLLLGHICSHWRAVAFSTPRLWDSLHVSAEFVSRDLVKSAAIVDWLTRAGSRPLSLSISC